MTDKPFIQQPTNSILTHYKTPIEFADKQLSIFWLPDEIQVDKDIQSIAVDMTEQERHAVLTTLRLFTLYELKAGGEYWGDRFVKTFPRPEFRRMASVFSMFELAVHAPFYNKLNEALNVNTDSFYLSYVQDPVLSERMDFIDQTLNHGDDLLSTAVFSLIEGAVLYAPFSLLKSFQANGKNKITNVGRGIDFSVRDESIHSIAGAWSFQQLWQELGKPSHIWEGIHQASEIIREHEYQIINKLFQRGPIDGITASDMRDFVDHRIALCQQQLGMPVTMPPKGVIEGWFYKNINNFKFNDFFAGVGREYRRDWAEERLVW